MPADLPQSADSVRHPRHVRIAAAIGNWNDRRYHPDSYDKTSRTYRAIDRFVGWLYCLGERAPHNGRSET